MNRMILAAALLVALCPSTIMAQGMAAAAGDVVGGAQFKAPGADSWNVIVKGQPLTDGTEIKTPAGASVTIAMSNGTKLRIGPLAVFKLEKVSASKISVFIGLGKLECWVKKFAKRGTFQARSKLAVAAVRGTVLSMDMISPTQVAVDVFEGSISLADAKGNVQPVAQGQRVEATPEGAGKAAPQPPGTQAPAEPSVAVPAAPAAAPAATEAAPAESTTEPAPKQTTTSPTQETSTVSPSSP